MAQYSTEMIRRNGPQNTQFAIENDLFIVDLPIQNGDVSRYVHTTRTIEMAPKSPKISEGLPLGGSSHLVSKL